MKVGLKTPQTYIMAYFNFCKNYNGTDTVSRIVIMVCFKNSGILMARIQLTLYLGNYDAIVADEERYQL